MRKTFQVGLPVVGAMAVWLLFLSNSWRGLDFGYHWDEAYTQTSVRKSIETGILVPNFFFYPGVCYDLGLLAVLPQAYREITGEDTFWTTQASQNAERSKFDIVQERLTSYADSADYLLKYRALTSLVSSILIFVVFGIGWLAGGSAWIGLTIAMLAAASFEFTYHSRWGVPDAMTAAFAGLTILLSLVAVRKQGCSMWINLASIAAGLTVATKYPGAIVLIVVWVGIARIHWPDFQTIFKQSLKAAGITIVTFLVLSPGTLLNPLRFYDSLQYIKSDYATGHPGHTISPGIEHWRAIFEYLTMSLISNSVVLSVGISLLVILGAGFLWRKNRTFLLMLVLPSVLYILYMGSQRVFFVRNFLIMLPVWLAFAAAGLAMLWLVLKRAKWLPEIAVAFLLIIGGVRIIEQANLSRTIVTRVEDRPERLNRLMSYLTQLPASVTYSPRIRAELLTRGYPPPAISAEQVSFGLLAFYASETWGLPVHWHGDNRKLTVATFGPSEVDFNYYPMWAGEDRIVLMRCADARMIGVNFDEPSFGPWPLYEL